MAERIAEEKIDQVRQSVDIVELISDYVQLKKQGRNYFGLCPFHGESTPSFSVSPDKQIFHCFGCGAGGNAFSF
ncbi:MAG: CHC2 zinc finger domain-containing protein, partial [Bacillota bacterium]|nr:CHC2 zinc finger domain-containing protein [Bacillota bacterium]